MNKENKITWNVVIFDSVGWIMGGVEIDLPLTIVQPVQPFLVFYTGIIIIISQRV
jgi:hypothetical protein